MMSRILTFFCFVVLFSACSNESSKLDLVPLDLMKYGAPFTIMAPDSVSVEEEDNLISKDLVIKYGKEYDVLIQIQDAVDVNFDRLKKEQEDLVSSGKYFSRIVESDAAGFIFENKVDSSYVNYGFRYMILQNDKEYIFQSGLFGNYDLNSIEQMFEAVRQ
jgi:hypothetical protein